MVATIANIINAMETIAPIWLAEEWDNVGLQVGQKDWAAINKAKEELKGLYGKKVKTQR